MSDCLFCNMIAGRVPAQKIYEDDLCFAFHDIAPVAPVHFLVIPKKHIKSAQEISSCDSDIVGHIFIVIARLAQEQGLQGGYRVITNSGSDAIQTVLHLHFHVIGGKKLPPKLG